MRALGQLGADPLLECQLAFDAVAPGYDGPLGNNALVQRLRARLRGAVLERLRTTSSEQSLLDLGCGPGQDAEFFARRGDRVMAIDWAPGMVEEARQRVARAGLSASVDILHVGIHQLDRLSGHLFDGIYSNLGPLNCVPDLSAAARAIFGLLRSRGWLITSVIGRVCPWELMLFAVTRNWTRSRLRFDKAAVPVPLERRTVWTRYYAPSEFRAAFEAAGFQHAWHRGLGLLVPPPYMLAFAERHPRLIDVLQAAEDHIAAWPGVREWGDHFLIVMRKP